MPSPVGHRRILLSPSFSVRSEASEAAAPSNEVLAGGCVSNSSSRSRSLASGALWERGGEASVSGRDILHVLGCSLQTLGNGYYTWQRIRAGICYFLVRWRVLPI